MNKEEDTHGYIILASCPSRGPLQCNCHLLGSQPITDEMQLNFITCMLDYLWLTGSEESFFLPIRHDNKWMYLRQARVHLIINP